MKHIIFICSLLLASVSVSSQKYWDGSRPDHRITIGVRAGLSMPKFIEDDTEWRYRLGYQAGIEVDVNLVRSLSINTGAYCIQKGFKMELEYNTQFSQEYEYKPVYIQVPLALSYRIKLSDSSQFQLNAGGYFAYGLKNSDKAFFDGKYKNEDAGITLGAAITYSHYYFGANYERSLMNIGYSSSKCYNSVINISLGYNF